VQHASGAGFSVSEILEATQGELLIAGSPHARFSGVSIDSRTLKGRGDIFVCIKGSRFDGHNFIPEAIGKGVRCVIVSRRNNVVSASKSPAAIICVRDTLCALSALAHYHRRRFSLPVVAVTGSNGKTTTKEMLGALLSAKYRVLKNEGTQNNLIGLSLSLLRLHPDHDIAVLELGSNHFGEIKELTEIASPNVGIITNIGPAHLEFFGDESGVFKEKWSLIEGLAHPYIAVLNADDNFLKAKLPNGMDGVFFSFGIRHKCDFMAKKIVCAAGKTSFYINKYPVKLNTLCRVNVYNALAAYVAARIFGVDAYDIIKKFREFHFPDSRFQLKKINGIFLIDDAYNANPASFLSAIQALSGLSVGGRKIVVMADMLELGNEGERLHREIGRHLSKADIDVLIGVGKLSRIACDAAERAGGLSLKTILRYSSAQDARNNILGLLKKGDTVLLKGSRAMHLEEIFNNSHG
jgi:UDP-N-acetylmuramoyl-tripeptide--D-alanyl-D-alanine ligase